MVEDKCNVYQRSSKESEISDLEERTLSVFSAQYSMQHEVARQTVCRTKTDCWKIRKLTSTREGESERLETLYWSLELTEITLVGTTYNTIRNSKSGGC